MYYLVVDEGNNDSGELNEINVQVVPLEGDAGSAILVNGVIPEATSELLQALISFCMTEANDAGLDFEEVLDTAYQLYVPRDPIKMH